MPRNFMEMIRQKWGEDKFLCVGMDTDFLKIPSSFTPQRDRSLKFNQMIVDETKDLVCAYKLNSAFYEADGIPGIRLLTDTLTYIRRTAADVPVILDCKRGDIGNTNEQYAEAFFGKFKVDAITVHPYTGSKAMKSFLEHKNKGIIVLCKTSNEGSDEFQGLTVLHDSERKPLYQVVAETVRDIWNYNDNCILVAGATYPEELKQIRAIVGDMPLLIPGIGKQGGDLQKAVEAGIDSKGQGIIINSSSGIIFAENPRAVALALHTEIKDVVRLAYEIKVPD